MKVYKKILLSFATQTASSPNINANFTSQEEK